MTMKHSPQQKKNADLRWGVLGIVVLFIAAAAYSAPQFFNRGIDAVNGTVALGIPNIPEKPFQLGLDLQGGAHLTYQAQVDTIPFADRAEAVEGVRDVIERRVNGFGVSEPNVQTAKVGEEYRINVELAGIQDINTAIKMIGETPILEFQEQNTVPPRELTKEEEAQIVTENKEAQTNGKEVLKKLKNGEAFDALVSQHSEDESSKNNAGYIDFVRDGLTGFDSLYSWAKNNEPGDISTELIESDAGYHILKRGGERAGETQVSAKHILICYLGAQNCDNAIYTKQEAEAKAQEIFDQANGDNFESLAVEFSTDPSAQINKGDLGTFGKGRMVPAFETAVFAAKVGEIVGPVESPLGYHVIYKTNEVVGVDYELWHIFFDKTTASDILPVQNPWMQTGLSGKQLERAEVVSNPTTGAVQVSLQFDSEGATLFEDITRRNIGKPIAIFLDGSAISIPNVDTVIPQGKAIITGNFTIQEAQELAKRLNTGALPVPIELVSQQSIGASLGAVSLAQSVKAGVVGILLIMVFMLFYYRLPGLVSIFSLSLYVALTLAVFKLVGVTLTLAGIAGFILSIGMAIDANVLIFERLKEELQQGRSLRGAIEEGFLRAWSSIRDGNVSTLITCALLVWFGSSFVQGFAITLIIGILVSMFSAITITRVILRVLIPLFPEKANSLFLGYTKPVSK